MSRKLAKAAFAVAAAVSLALVGTPGAAHADVNTDYAWAYWQAPGSTTSGGYGVLMAYGEILQVQDWHADGWGTRAQIQKLLPDSNGVMHWVNHSTNCFDD